MNENFFFFFSFLIFLEAYDNLIENYRNGFVIIIKWFWLNFRIIFVLQPAWNRKMNKVLIFFFVLIYVFGSEFVFNFRMGCCTIGVMELSIILSMLIQRCNHDRTGNRGRVTQVPLSPKKIFFYRITKR